MNRVPRISIKQVSNGKFQTDFTDPSTGKRHRNQYESLAEAELAKTDIEDKYRGGNTAYFSKMLIGELIKKHLEDRPQSKLLERKNVFKAFNDQFGSIKLTFLSEDLLRKWLLGLQAENNYTDQNMLHIKSQLNHFFNYLVEKNYYIISPLSKIKFKRKSSTQHRTVLSKEEIQSLLEKAQAISPVTLYPFLYTLVHTGMRRSEALDLTWNRVDNHNGLIHLVNTKTGENRSISMSEKLAKLLKSMPQTHDHVFTNGQHGPLRRQSLNRLIDKLRRHCVLSKHWGCHTFRHSFAYHYLKQGGQMYQLQAILGHSTIHLTVDLYGRITAEDIEKPSPFDF